MRRIQKHIRMKATEAKKASRPAKTTDAVAIMERMIGDDAGSLKAVEEAHINVAVAQLLYDVRTKAGLTQKQLADLVGTKQPVIARLEDADYDGHSLSMLARIAAALGHRVEIHLKPVSHKEAA